ncbi:MAG: ABC transporter permease [Armatimonadota bacterium]
MWDRFSFSVGVRQLRYGLAQTALTMGVVAISVSLIIFLGSLIGGLQKRLISNITGSIPQIVISQPERYPIPAWQIPEAQEEGRVYIGERPQLAQRQQRIEDWQLWDERLVNFDKEVIAISPVVTGQAILSKGAKQKGITIIGAIPERHNQVIDLQSKLVSGDYLNLDIGEIAIGYPIADDFDLGIGDNIRLTTSGGQGTTYRLKAIFDTGFEGVDENTVFVPLRTAQSLFGTGAAVTAIDIKLADVFEANRIAERLRLQVPYQVDSWMQQNQQLLTALRAQSTSAALILTFTTIAAGFAIASILITSVTSKLREIGILRAIGATRMQIIGIFTIQSTLMAMLGAFVGAPLGIGISLLLLWFRTIPSAAGRQETIFPITLRWQLIVGSMVIAVAVGFMASLYPASRASKVNPIEVIRGG